MRILIYSAAEKADGGGVQGVVNGLAAYLRIRGHQVITAWPDGDGSPTDWAVRLTADVGAEGRPSSRALLRAGSDFAKLMVKLIRFRPDVVNLHYPRGQTLYFKVLQKVLGFKLVFSFHGSDYHEASDALLERLPSWLRTADGVTAVSEALAKGVGSLSNGAELEVIENGIDAKFWCPDSAPEAERDLRLFVAAGRLVPVKGFDILLTAMAREEAGNTRLVIAGDGPDEADLRARIASHGLTERVRLAGRLDRNEMRNLFRRAGWFVLSSRREGLPLVILEAMATGLPLVATKVGGVPVAMGKGTGALVEPLDAGALARAIGKRAGNDALFRSESQAARRRAERYGAKESFRRYESLFESLR